MQVTLDVPHEDAGLSEIVTGPLPEGRTSIQNSSNSVLSTRRLPFATPPVMSSASRTALFLSNGSVPSKISSLNTSRNPNLLAPLCSAGTSANCAVRGAAPSSSADVVAVPVPGCAATEPSHAVVSIRPSAVHSAPAVPHSRFAASTMVMFPVPSGVTVISHRSLRPSTRLAPVTLPPLTSNALSRTSTSPFAMSSLSTSRKVNGVSPSWVAGVASTCPVSGAASSSCAALSGSPVHCRCTSSSWSGLQFGSRSPTPAW